jgi:23S rRNA (uracil1939-C5)-methyltransferase
MNGQEKAEQLVIGRLGHQGDGIALPEGKSVYISGALPGETVSVSGKGARRQLISIDSPSPERTEPFCPLFGQCGGCQVQHLTESAYRDWKTGLLFEAFGRESIDIAPEPLLTFERRNRRRAVFTAQRFGAKFVFGFLERQSNRIAPVAHCPILVAELDQAIPAMTELAEIAAPRKGALRISAVSCVNGIDLSFDLPGRIGERLFLELTTHPAAAGLLRISINGETAIAREQPILAAGTARVMPPPGAFVQASAAAEQAIADLVTGHLGANAATVDLFSGFGPFALRLAETSTVHAVEAERAALDALEIAWRGTAGKLKAITTERRDLFRAPLIANELNRFDGVVFDPPRAGAEAQARELAQSDASLIAAVSCNPFTLARDCRILIDGGYSLESLTPVDQFAHTGHLEAVALFKR